MSADTAALLQTRLQAALQPQQLEIIDDSARHAGHAGAAGGGHFQVSVVAPCFAGLGRLARHRLVQAAAGDLMNGRIHALGIVAKAPGEV